MEFTKEQLENIRKQLISQIQGTFPEEQKEETIRKINEMNDLELIEFLKQNNLINTENSEEDSRCLFCSLANGKMPSTRIGENEKAIAILELNPISEGHTIVIPKEHITERNGLPQEIYDLTKEVGEKLNASLMPKEIKVLEGEVMDHQIINLLPVYENETLESPRTKQTPEQLLELKNKIDSSSEKINVPEKKNLEIQEQKKEVLTEKENWLPRRKP